MGTNLHAEKWHSFVKNATLDFLFIRQIGNPKDAEGFEKLFQVM